MRIGTASGVITIDKDSAFGLWLQGWKEGKGWTGRATLASAWARAQEIRPADCSWKTLGRLMAGEQALGKELAYAGMAE